MAGIMDVLNVVNTVFAIVFLGMFILSVIWIAAEEAYIRLSGKPRASDARGRWPRLWE